MAVPYQKSETLTVASNPQTFEISYANRVFLTGVRVSQLGGGTDSFTVQLYDKNPAATGGVNAAAHRIMPAISVTSGVGSFFSSEGVPFVNQEDSPPQAGKDSMWVTVTGLASGSVDLTISSRSAEFGK